MGRRTGEPQHMGDHFIAIEKFYNYHCNYEHKGCFQTALNSVTTEPNFTGVDDNNIVAYDDINTIEACKGTQPQAL